MASTDLIGLAGELPSAAEFERAVLDLCQREVGFDVAFLSVKGAESSPAVAGLGLEIVAQAVRGGSVYERELMPVKAAALGARGVAVDTEVFGERGMQRHAYYREVARRVGGRHSLLGYVPLRGRIVAALMLGRSGPGFSAAEVARVEGLLGDLGVARGSYGLPLRFEPLHQPVRPGWRERLGQVPRPLAAVSVRAATVLVRDRAGFREMVAKEGGSELIWTRAALADPSVSGWPYVELFHLAAISARSRRRALFIGSGGAVAPRQFAQLYPGLALDLVERDLAVVQLAREFYELDAIPGLSVHVADGAEFVARARPQSWDVAVVDAFDATALRQPLLERPFFAALSRALTPGGALGVNVIGTLGSGLVADVVRVLREEIGPVRILPVVAADEDYSPCSLRNVVLIATREGV
jgi:spermidine synthase